MKKPPVLTDETLLGLPPMADLAERFYEEIELREDKGCSPRDMHRKNPEIPLRTWMDAGAYLHKQGRVKHTWRPLMPKNDAILQESCYLLAKDPLLG